jgi:hypothetical protein
MRILLNTVGKILVLFASFVSFGFSITPNTWTEQSPSEPAEMAHDGWYDSTYRSANNSVLFMDGYEAVWNDPDCGNIDLSGGSSDIYADAIYEWDLDADTVTTIAVVHWYKGDGTPDAYTHPFDPCNTNYPTPVSRHPMCIAYNAANDEVFIGPGLNNTINGALNEHPDDVWVYDFQSGWSELTITGTPPYVWDQGDPHVPSCEYDPDIGNLHMVSIREASGSSTEGTLRINRSSLVGTFYTGTRPTNPYDIDATAYDTKRDKLWFWSGNSAPQTVWSWGGSSWTSYSPTNYPDSTKYPAFAYNSRMDVLMVAGGESDTDTWIYPPAVNDWKQIETSGVQAALGTGTYNIEHDVLAVRSGAATTKYYAYRYEPFETDAAAHSTSVLSNPVVNTWTLDPDHGGWFLRFMDSGANRVYHTYGNETPISKDNTYVYLWNNGTFTIYQINDDPGATPTSYDTPTLGGGSFNCAYWAVDDDDVLYYTSGTTFYKYTASTKTVDTVVKDTSAVFSTLSEHIPGDLTGQYFVFHGRNAADNDYIACRWDKTGDSWGTCVTGLDNDTEVYISPDGTYLLANRGVGPLVYDASSGALLRNLDTQAGTAHGDVAEDENGIQWWVYERGFDCTLRKARMSSGTNVELLDISAQSNCSGGHVSARHTRNEAYTGADTPWVMRSSYTTATSRADGMDKYEDEIIRVYLDSTSAVPHIERFVKHRTTVGIDEYWNQPHAATSYDGKWVLWGSDWEAAADTDIDVYMGWLPPANLSPPAEVVNPTVDGVSF